MQKKLLNLRDEEMKEINDSYLSILDPTLMDWDEAMESSKKHFGFRTGEYIEDFKKVVDYAKYLMDEQKEENIENLQGKHEIYLQSKRWKRIRKEVNERENYKCQDCKADGKIVPSVDVHHLNYDCLLHPSEAENCIAVCRQCHQGRHNIFMNSTNSQRNLETKKHITSDIFCKKFGISYRNRVLDIILQNKDYEFDLYDISIATNIGNQQAGIQIDEMLKEGLIKKTKKIDFLQPYKLNTSNTKTITLLKQYVECEVISK